MSNVIKYQVPIYPLATKLYKQNSRTSSVKLYYSCSMLVTIFSSLNAIFKSLKISSRPAM